MRHGNHAAKTKGFLGTEIAVFNAAEPMAGAMDVSTHAAKTHLRQPDAMRSHVSRTAHLAVREPRRPYATRFNETTGRCFLPA